MRRGRGMAREKERGEDRRREREEKLFQVSRDTVYS